MEPVQPPIPAPRVSWSDFLASLAVSAGWQSLARSDPHRRLAQAVADHLDSKKL